MIFSGLERVYLVKKHGISGISGKYFSPKQEKVRKPGGKIPIFASIKTNIMDDAQLRFVFDQKKQANNGTKKRLLQIEIRLKETNKRKTVSTGIRLYKNQFSDKNGFTCRNHLNASLITVF